MPISVANPTEVRGVAAPLRAIVRAALALQRQVPGDIDVLLAGDETLRALNKRWRGLDRATDVLSFARTDGPPGRRVSGDLAISLEGATVTLRGERKPAGEAGASVHRSERPVGAFRRAFDLPVPIDADKAEAVHRNGVLTLRLPKAPEHRPRQIRVKAE